ncbi:hypothetical protein WG66_016380 [Moniliophthora roreri]|nr:hypothetical protein WG66_016380 [Moniliophthora roreri]
MQVSHVVAGKNGMIGPVCQHFSYIPNTIITGVENISHQFPQNDLDKANLEASRQPHTRPCTTLINSDNLLHGKNHTNCNSGFARPRTSKIGCS